MKFKFALMLLVLLSGGPAMALLPPRAVPSGTLKVKVQASAGSNLTAWAYRGGQTWVTPVTKGVAVFAGIPLGDWQLGLYGWELETPVSAQVKKDRATETKLTARSKTKVEGTAVRVEVDTASLTRVQVLLVKDGESIVATTDEQGLAIFPSVGKGEWEVRLISPGVRVRLERDYRLAIANQKLVTLRLRISVIIFTEVFAGRPYGPSGFRILFTL